MLNLGNWKVQKSIKKKKLSLMPSPGDNQCQQSGVLYILNIILVDIFPQLLRLHVSISTSSDLNANP